MGKQTDWKDAIELLGVVAIVLSLILVAYELRQNTTMMKAQTRDSLTEKQMMFSEWFGTNRYSAEIAVLVNQGQVQPGSPEFLSFQFLVQGIMREWENSFYQYEQGLFEREEFEPRKTRWRKVMSLKSMRDYWATSRDEFSPKFRAELDSIVQHIELNSGVH